MDLICTLLSQFSSCYNSCEYHLLRIKRTQCNLPRNNTVPSFLGTFLKGEVDITKLFINTLLMFIWSLHLQHVLFCFPGALTELLHQNLSCFSWRVDKLLHVPGPASWPPVTQGSPLSNDIALLGPYSAFVLSVTCLWRASEHNLMGLMVKYMVI